MPSSAQIPVARQARNGDGRRVERVAFGPGELSDDSTGHSILRLARELRRRGKEVGLLCGGGVLVGELERIGVSPVVSRQLASGGTPLWVSRKLLAHLRELEPDLIHVFGRALAGWGTSNLDPRWKQAVPLRCAEAAGRVPRPRGCG